MRILAITFALALFGCVDETTPEGIGDIEESTDDYEPDTHKSDVGQTEPFGDSDVPTAQSLRAPAPKINAGPKATVREPTRLDAVPPRLNTVPDSSRR